MFNEKKYALAFNCLISFDYQLYKRLMDKFGSLQKAFYSPYLELLSVFKSEKKLSLFIRGRKSFSFTDIFFKLEKEGINLCFIQDDNYPKYLKSIYNPPPLFYYKGNLNINWSNSLAVVGARRFSDYGQKIVEKIIPGVSCEGVAIVSGLALGIDSLSHRATLKSRGKTVGVLGSGLDQSSIYPYSNKYLALEIIASGGLLISEFPLGTKPLAHHFPQRNRIIAGLTPVTLVVEAGIKSGSLITAKSALEEGREVCSIPGDIFCDNLAGNNFLLQNGAGLILEIADILAYFAITPRNTRDREENLKNSHF